MATKFLKLVKTVCDTNNMSSMFSRQTGKFLVSLSISIFLAVRMKNVIQKQASVVSLRVGYMKSNDTWNSWTTISSSKKTPLCRVGYIHLTFSFQAQCLYIYIYTHTHTHIYMCVCVCVCVCIYIYNNIYLYTYTNKHCFAIKKHTTHSGSSVGWDTEHNLPKISVNDFFHYVILKGSYWNICGAKLVIQCCFIIGNFITLPAGTKYVESLRQKQHLNNSSLE
jgi:hypothetical protein